ncbi:hypothetical protein [Bosea sp. (in: a-proteobacteria)]|uniref:hypothetical protein n=1 Tax=Bosea sp. (in: a-proteobacteria) TaxID=1871050 RepID=UPI0031FF012D
MGSERDAARKAAKNPESTDPELEAALSEGAKLQLATTRETNRHKESMRGIFERMLGPREIAGTALAGIAMIVGLIGCGYFAYVAVGAIEPAKAEFAGRWAERALGFAASCLAYIFGKGTR